MRSRPSPNPLPPYEEWRKGFEAIPWTGHWTGYKGSEKWRWHFDGGEFHQYPINRGPVVGGAPAELQKLRDWFRARPEFEVVQMLAFPVSANGK